MWSYSTSDPQRPQAGEQSQEFLPRPPHAHQMCRLQWPRCSTRLLASRRDQTAIPNTTRRRRGSLPNPHAGSTSDLAKLVAGETDTRTDRAVQVRQHHRLPEGSGKQESQRRSARGLKAPWDEVPPVRLEGRPSVKAAEVCLRRWARLNNEN